MWCLSACTQVMKLGVIRVLAKKIPALLKVLCKGGFARWGPWKKTIVAMSERSRHVGRLSDASTVAPGYVFLKSLVEGRASLLVLVFYCRYFLRVVFVALSIPVHGPVFRRPLPSRPFSLSDASPLSCLARDLCLSCIDIAATWSVRM